MQEFLKDQKTVSKTSVLPQRKIHSGQETCRIPRATEENQKSLNILRPSIENSKIFNRPQTGDVYYTTKYLGVTKGQMGILTRKSLMPCLSSYETCKNVPLSVINSALKPDRIASEMIKGIIAQSNQEFKNIDEVSVSKDSDVPHPEEYDEFVIHKYARPNGLTALRKPVKQITMPVPIKIEKKREGITGWKLSRPSIVKPRPKSSTVYKPAVKVKIQSSKKEYLDEFHNEIYLKYLHDKHKSPNLT